jgi:hypothetical protein
MSTADSVSLCIVSKNDFDESTVDDVESIVNRLEHNRVTEFDEAKVGIVVSSDVVRIFSEGKEADTLCDAEATYREVQFSIEKVFSELDSLYFKDKKEAVKDLSYFGSRSIINLQYVLQISNPWCDEVRENLWNHSKKVKNLHAATGDPEDDVISLDLVPFVLAKAEGLDAVSNIGLQGRGSSADRRYLKNMELLANHFELDIGDNL